jgi:hypothetical protein
MEVFIMEPETAIEIKNAIELAQENYPIIQSDGAEPSKWRSPNRQWDRIINKVCSGCGKRLGRYENKNNLAYCFECREILFPESIPARKSFRKRFPLRGV